MENQLGLTIKGLKCDNKECRYRDDTIHLNEYKLYIDAPCPDCGESLLTKEDYMQVQNIIALVDAVNSMKDLDSEGTEEQKKVTFNLNGTGEVAINVEEYKGELEG